MFIYVLKSATLLCTNTNTDTKSQASTKHISDNTSKDSTPTLDQVKTIASIVSSIVGLAVLIFAIYKWKKKREKEKKLEKEEKERREREIANL